MFKKTLIYGLSGCSFLLALIVAFGLGYYQGQESRYGQWETLRFRDPSIQLEPTTQHYINRSEKFLDDLERLRNQFERAKESDTVPTFVGWVRKTTGYDTVFRSPFGVAADFDPTPGHSSYMLNYYDNQGRLWLSYLGGTGYRTGPIPYGDFREKQRAIGYARKNFFWNIDPVASPVGHLVADAMRSRMDADVALINFLGMRAHLSKGKIVKGHLKRVLPFRNTTVVVEITGNELRTILDKGKSPPDHFLGSGVHFSDDHYQIGDEVLQKNRPYEVAISSYMANGGRFGQYRVFADNPRLRVSDNVQWKLLAEYIEKNTPISPDGQPRLIHH